MEQHLTVREAREFTGKSESTLKRLIREITGTAGHPDREFILPPAEEVARRRQSGDVFVWKINKDLLLRRFPRTEAGEEGSNGRDAAALRNDDGNAAAIMQVLREQLLSKDRQIQTLETQLDRKDDQIKSLNDRMHESNILMRELQTRLAIAAPINPKPADTIVVGEGSEKKQNIEKSKVEPQARKSAPKRRSFLARLFSKK
jgi:hypothetical protein